MERIAPTETAETDLLADAMPGSDLSGCMPVHRLFEERACQAPAALAVADGGRRLCYAELDRRASALARRLRSLGVGPEARVGVFLPRSLELVVAVLAVLKAGGAYVALDPRTPKERLAFQLGDSGAPVLLTARGPLSELAASKGILCVFPEEMPDEAAAEPGAEVAPGNLAYVIYTSGSTGVPKGVEISHGSLRSLVDWHVRAFGVAAPDRTTLLAGVGFDASVWEMWPCLAMGAALVVVPDEVRATPAALIAWLAREEVTVSFLPTPLAEAVLPLTWPQGTSLRFLLAGGDRLHQPPPPSLPFTLVNNYGPTEGTVVATSGVVAPRSGAVRPPSIGRPLPHVRTFVVDRELRPVPEGSGGELLLGGPALARGYLGRPDLTAGSFVPDPFGSPETAGERLYRTGDMVRLLPNGELEFLGRIDDQVKIRGHRIELGEIGAALARHPEVREAVVLAREAWTGRRLVAYLTGAAAVSDAELREFLLESLPEVLVPSVFVRLAALPLTANGKVDRKALPEPSEEDRAEPYAAPRTPVEERLAQVWAQALGCGRVGIHDSFFELGGHSLVAARILSRIADDFGVELTLRSLFTAPTVAALAEAVQSSSRAVTERPARQPRHGRLPLSFAQERLWFLDRLEPGRPTYNVGSAVALHGPLDEAALRAALSAVVCRHEALRTRFVEVDGEPWQEVLPASPIALPRIDLSALPGPAAAAELERLGLLEARRRFDLAQGPLLRAMLARLGKDRYVLLVNLHHIVFDGWSEGVFWRDLSALYPAPHLLPDLPLQYADYAVWQRRRLDGERLAELVEWWRSRLKGLAPLDLPTDRPRPAVRTFRGGARPIHLPEPLSGAVRDLGRRAGATPFMVLLAAFSALLSRYSGQEGFAVGVPVAGREASGLEGLIGMFVNMLALRADLGGQPSFRELVARTRETALASFAHQELAFDRLVYELNPERDLSRNPVFQVSFQVVDEARRLPALPGIESSSPGLHTGTVKFDLDVELEDRGEAVRGQCEYSSDLFDSATIDRLLVHFEILASEAVAAPDLPVADLPLLSEAERQQLLEWHDASTRPAPSGPVRPPRRRAGAVRARSACRGWRRAATELRRPAPPGGRPGPDAAVAGRGAGGPRRRLPGEVSGAGGLRAGGAGGGWRLCGARPVPSRGAACLPARGLAGAGPPRAPRRRHGPGGVAGDPMPGSG